MTTCKTAILYFIVIITLLFSIPAFSETSKSEASSTELTMNDMLSPATLFQPFKQHTVSWNLDYYYEYVRDYASGTIGRLQVLDSYFGYGLTERLKIIIETPFDYLQVKGNDIDEHYYSPDDFYFYFQYLIYAKNNMVLAVTPLFSIPTGDYKNGLGNGRSDYGINFISGKIFGNLKLSLQYQYTRNENKIDSERNIWSVSLIPEYSLTDHFNLLFGANLQKDTDPLNDRIPLYLTFGFRYFANKVLTITPSVEIGYNKRCKDVKTTLWFYMNF